MTLAEKLAEVANNRPKLYKKGALDYSPQETVSGESISITDISPIEHNMGVSVRGKNLIPFPYESKTQTKSGVTFTVNDDGTINVNGTATANTTFVLKQNILLKKGSTYTVSGCPSGGSIATYCLYIQDMGYHPGVAETGNGRKFTTEYEEYYMWITINNGATINNLVFKPMLEEGTTSTSFTPYIEDISTVKLYKQGKNILKYPYYYSTKTLSGITYTDNGDGSITVNGTSTAFTLFEITQQSKNDCSDLFENGVTYKLSSGVDNSIVRLVLGARKISENKAVYYYSGDTFTVDKSTYKYEWIRLQIENGKTVNNVTVYPMIEIGNSATEYEPYIEPTVYDVPTDGTVEGVKSLYPSTSLYTDTSGAVIDCTYYQDGRKVKENLTDMILSLGGVINE